MTELNQRLLSDHGIEFALCVGVNTGEVLAGKVGEDYTVIGDAVNVASRLQSSASPGTITVGERTQRATSGVVEYEPLEPLELKGKAEPVAAWRVIGLSEKHTGVARRSSREAPLVGREDEFAALQMLLARVARNNGPHLATVFGQAGVGKTRLLREFERSLDAADPPVRQRRGRCLSFGSSVVYWPLSEMLRAECAIVDGDPMEVAWAKLERRLGSLLGSDGDEDGVARRIAPLARLLGIEVPDMPAPPEGEDAQSARDTFFAAVRAYLEALAQGQPLVLAWEDIHWADEGMLDLIEYLSQWLRAPVLQVCLARDELLERRPGWGASRRTTTSLFLDPLHRRRHARADRDAAARCRRQTGGARRAGRARGGQSAVRRGDGPAARRGRKQQGGRAARHRAGPVGRAAGFARPLERHLVAHAGRRRPGVLGGALAPVAEAEGGDLQAALSTLREKDIIVPGEGVRLADEQELAFKHVLIRDVAYGTLPKAVRARKHFEVGMFIEQRAGERLHEVVALLAEHYGRAATLGAEVHLDPDELAPLRSKALQFLEAAGDAASALYSNQEALGPLRARRHPGEGDQPQQARLREKQGDLALRLGRVDAAIEVWEQDLDFYADQEDLEHVAELHRKIGARWPTRDSEQRPSSTTSRGST